MNTDEVEVQPTQEPSSQDVPPGKDENPVDEIREKFGSILEESTGEGRLGVKVFDKDGNEKQRVEYLRVEGEGSIEAWKYDDTQGQDLGAEATDSNWAIRKRKKLGHTRR